MLTKNKIIEKAISKLVCYTSFWENANENKMDHYNNLMSYKRVLSILFDIDISLPNELIIKKLRTYKINPDI